MNCPSFERLIALWVEGDLPGSEAAAVEEHLRTCSPCHQFAQELKASQAALGILRQDTVEERVFRSLRAGVLKKLPVENARPSVPTWQYALAAGLIVVLAVSVLKLALPSKAPTKLAPVAASHPASAPAARPAPSLPPHPLSHASGAGGPARQARSVLTARADSEGFQTSQPLTIKLVTDNPNVVIYWLVD